MGLDLGTLSARIEIRDDGVTSKLSRVKSQLSDVDKAAQNVGRSKIDITPKGTGDLDKAKSSAQNLGRELGTASSAAQRMTVPTQAASELDRAATSGGRLRGVISALSDVAPIVGVGAAAGGVAAGFQAALKIGNEYTNELNTMNAVSGATESQMRQISQAARELGNDTSLANVSASDAAAAMTELAKGGMSVDQAMAAAKGTLQLSAAASIDAASAATIQSQALQAFGLNADYAAKASDVLANAANASSAEITGIAQGLQQSGAVANQFGLSLEDTSASLAMLANAGIQGSDAGTLLKSTLLALTDQGKPAQAAMEELGLTVYDAQGKFVGMSSLMGQLEQASKSMSDEQYQAATATLFGSDAMRLAGVAAQQGQAGYDKMREAMDRQGAAAEVAAAKTQGLPGAIGKVQNAAEELGLALYDMVDGPLEAGLTGVASGISGIGAAMSNVPAPVFAGGIALVASKFLDLNGKATSGVGSIRNFGAAVRDNQRFFGQMGREIGMVTSAMVTLEQRSPGMHRFANSVRDSAGPLMMMGRESRLAAAEVTGMGRVALLARGHVETLGGVAKGVAGGGLSLLKTGASGLVSFLGGPWGIAIAGATTALGFLAQKHQEAAQEEAEHKAKQSELRDTLDQTTGAITAQTNELQRKRAEESGFLETANQLGIASGVVVDAMNGEKGAIDQVNAAVEAQGTKVLEASDYWQSYKDKFQAAGLNQADVLRAMRGELEEGSDAQKRFLDVSQQINEAEGGAYSGHKKWQEAKDQINGATDAAHKLREGVQGAATDLEKISSAAAAQSMVDFKKETQDAANVMDILGDKVAKVGSDPTKITVEMNEAEAAATIASLDKIGVKADYNSETRTLEIDLENGAGILNILGQLGDAVHALPNGRIDLASNTAEEKQKLVDLGLATNINGEIVMRDDIQQKISKLVELGTLSVVDGKLTVSDNIDEVAGRLKATDGTKVGADMHVNDNVPQVRANVDSLNNRNTSSTHTIYQNVVGGSWEGYYGAGGRGVSTSGTAVGQHYKHGGRIPALARGGTPSGGYRLPNTGPGTEKIDGFLGVDSAGIPTALVNRNEWVVNDKRSSLFNATLAAINSGTKENILAAISRELPQLRSGGQTASSRVKSELSGMSGTPYVFGGWSPAGTDCSGAVSAAVNSYLGDPPFSSRMSTASEGQWLEARGFQRGRGGPGDLRVGYMNGGPGGGHTAMQLPDGTYIESGGNTGGGFTIGGPAGPLEGRGFTDFYFLPGTGGESEESDSGSSYSSYRSTSSSAASTSGMSEGSVTKVVNGGTGPLLKDGSFLELVAAAHSATTGASMPDDVVSWGQLLGNGTTFEGDDLASKKREHERTMRSHERDYKATERDLAKARNDLEEARKNRDEAKPEDREEAQWKLDDAEAKIEDLTDKLEKMRDEQAQLRKTEEQLRVAVERSHDSTGMVTAMADGGIMGNARQAQINEGSSAVLWAEAGPEAYIPLSRNKRARAVDVWMETGKRLGINAMGMANLIGSTLPGLAEGKLEMSTGSSLSLDALGLNLDAAAYRGGRAIGGNPQAQQAVGAIFNGPVQINDPRQLLQGQLNNSTNTLRMAMRSVGM